MGIRVMGIRVRGTMVRGIRGFLPIRVKGQRLSQGKDQDQDEERALNP